MGIEVAHSSLFHASLGLLLLLIYSDDARLLFLRQLPKSMLLYLYRKSLLDVLIEPSPALKAYTVVALSAVLSDDEVRRLTDSLPRECDYMRRPGLIHMLPSTLQRALYSPLIHQDLEQEQAEVLAQEGSLVGEVAEADEGDFFVTPRFLHLGAESGGGHHDDGILDDVHGEDDDEEEGGPHLDGTMPVATHIVAAAASAPVPVSSSLLSTSEFERLVSDLLTNRVRQVQQQVVSASLGFASNTASDLCWYVLSGVPLGSNQSVISTCAACSSLALGIQLLIARASRLPRSSLELESSSRLLRVLTERGSSLIRAVSIASTSFAAACGFVLVVRGAAQTIMVLEEFTGPSRGVQLLPRDTSAIGTLRRVWIRVWMRCAR